MWLERGTLGAEEELVEVLGLAEDRAIRPEPTDEAQPFASDELLDEPVEAPEREHHAWPELDVVHRLTPPAREAGKRLAPVAEDELLRDVRDQDAQRRVAVLAVLHREIDQRLDEGELVRCREEPSERRRWSLRRSSIWECSVTTSC